MPVLQVAEELLKRQDTGANGTQIPTVAIVLLSILAIILVFGLARVAMQASQRRDTVPV